MGYPGYLVQPGAPGVVVGVIFDSINLEIPQKESINQFFSIVMKTPEDEIDTGILGTKARAKIPKRCQLFVYPISACSTTSALSSCFIGKLKSVSSQI